MFFNWAILIGLVLTLFAAPKAHAERVTREYYTCEASCRFDETRITKPIDPASTVSSGRESTRGKAEIAVDTACQKLCGEFNTQRQIIIRENCRITSCTCTHGKYSVRSVFSGGRSYDEQPSEPVETELPCRLRPDCR